MSSAEKISLKKIFAWIQILFSVVLAVCAVRFYQEIRESALKKDIHKIAEVTDSYVKIVGHGRDIYEKMYTTIPLHRKTLVTTCSKIDDAEVSCRKISRKIDRSIGKWVKNLDKLPMEMFQPLGEARTSMQQTIIVLDSIMEDKKQQDVAEAFNKTENGLREISSSLKKTEMSISAGSRIFLILLISMSVCFFANGMIVITGERGNKNP